MPGIRRTLRIAPRSCSPSGDLATLDSARGQADPPCALHCTTALFRAIDPRRRVKLPIPGVAVAHVRGPRSWATRDPGVLGPRRHTALLGYTKSR